MFASFNDWMQRLKSKTSEFAMCQGPPRDERTSRVTNEAASVERSTSSDLVVPSWSSSPPEVHRPVTVLMSAARWSRKYDVFVCNSPDATDIEEATRLVTFLEMAPRSFRCFMWHRDSTPGAAIASEMTQAIQDSHCIALLITPHFIQEDWCKYIVQQSLADGPMSNRTIPLIQNLPRDQYPKVLRCVFYVDLSTDPDRGYNLVCTTVLKVLHDMINAENAVEVGRTSFGEDG